MQISSDIWIVEESSYTVRSGTPIILLFSRSYNDPHTTIIHEFPYEPYFYVPYGSAKDVKSDLIHRVDDTITIDALGREVQKVYTYIPGDVPKVKVLFEWRDESDVLFDKRFLIDYKIRYAYRIEDGKPIPVELDNFLPPRRLYCDIEIDNPPSDFPEPKDANYPIIMIQCRDSLTNKRVVFTIKIPEVKPDVQIVCKNEYDLIKMYCTYVKTLDPDILVFWNGSGFDLPYIINRSMALGVPIFGLARTGQPKTSYENGRYSSRIPGRSTLDMLEAFKKFTSGMAQRESYSLKSVISDKELLGNYAFEYVDAGPYIKSYLNDERYEELIQYGLNDVDALYNIDTALNLYTFYESLKMISGAKIDDMLYNSRIIEMLLWHEGMKPMPEKNHVTNGDTFEGAFVVSPIPGISEYVGTYDLASLYPNIMIAFQKSPDIDGLVVKTLKKTLAMREELRAKCKTNPDNVMLENQQLAIKFLNNSYYGVLALPSFRLFDRSIAEFITSTGRELNMFLQDAARSSNFEVIFGDTDSIGVVSVKDVKIGKELESYLNNQLIRWSNERNCKVHFKLKFEKLYRRLLFKSDKNGKGVKKKYCGHIIWEEGHDKSELNYKGLELKRSDQSNITRDCLHYFLETLLITDDKEGAIAYVKQKYNDIISGEINIYDISIPKAIRKINYQSQNPWVDGREYAKTEYKYVIREGEKPRLVYLKGGNVICIDDEFDTSQIKDIVDWHKMANVIIRKKMESYIWSIGMDWNAVINGQQTFE